MCQSSRRQTENGSQTVWDHVPEAVVEGLIARQTSGRDQISKRQVIESHGISCVLQRIPLLFKMQAFRCGPSGAGGIDHLLPAQLPEPSYLPPPHLSPPHPLTFHLFLLWPGDLAQCDRHTHPTYPSLFCYDWQETMQFPFYWDALAAMAENLADGKSTLNLTACSRFWKPAKNKLFSRLLERLPRLHFEWVIFQLHKTFSSVNTIVVIHTIS